MFNENQIEVKQKTVRVIHSVTISKKFLCSDDMWVSFTKVFLWCNFLLARNKSQNYRTVRLKKSLRSLSATSNPAPTCSPLNHIHIHIHIFWTLPGIVLLPFPWTAYSNAWPLRNFFLIFNKIFCGTTWSHFISSCHLLPVSGGQPSPGYTLI